MKRPGTIAEVLERFLEDQPLSARTLNRYREVIELLQDCLNDCASELLDEDDQELFHRLSDAEGPEHREFCEIFGPEHILPNIDEFLDDYMVQLLAGSGLLRTAGTVTNKLAQWLHHKGYVSADKAQQATQTGDQAARTLPRLRKLAERLHAYVEDQDRHSDEEFEGHFTIASVGSDRIWLDSLMHNRRFGPFVMPQEIIHLCEPRWTVSGIVGRTGNTWKVLELWNVYP